MKPRCASIVVLAATLGATAAPAQYNPQQERRVALQRTGSSTGYARDWRDFHRYYVGRPEPGQSIYDADRYRRDARFYRPRTLAAGDRVYRGLSGLFYFRRPDGTTGRVEALEGGRFNGLLRKGGSASLASLADGALRRMVAGGKVICR